MDHLGRIKSPSGGPIDPSIQFHPGESGPETFIPAARAHALKRAEDARRAVMEAVPHIIAATHMQQRNTMNTPEDHLKGSPMQARNKSKQDNDELLKRIAALEAKIDKLTEQK